VRSSDDLEDSTIRADIAIIVGGRFSPDSLGRKRYTDIVMRVREHIERYLDIAAPLYLGEAFDARTHCEIDLSRLFRMVRDAHPARVRHLARQLLAHVDGAISEITATLGKSGSAVAGRTLFLLGWRRSHLRYLAAFADGPRR
jgi:hypothetical protein